MWEGDDLTVQQSFGNADVGGPYSLPDNPPPKGWIPTNASEVLLMLSGDSELQGRGFSLDYIPMLSTELSWLESDCSWLSGVAGSETQCPSGQLVTGLCSSLTANSCNGNAQEVKCCALPEMTEDSCESRGIEAGESFSCELTNGGLYSFITSTCSSLVADQCDGASQFSKARSICHES